MLNDLPKAAARPPDHKVLLLLLAGAGMVVALGLIGLGLYFWPRGQEQPVVAATSTPTAIVTPEPTTSLPGLVVIVPTRTPTPPPAPVPQSGDSVTVMATATRAPLATPTPVPVVRPQRTGPSLDGFIELIAPDDNIQIGDTVEFKWRWQENKGCEQPPEGYAFEIRVWRDNNQASPQGAMDAQAQKQSVACDPTTGIRSFTIGRIKTVPGFERLTEGRFRWDVAMVKLDPYGPVITTQFRTFFTN